MENNKDLSWEKRPWPKFPKPGPKPTETYKRFIFWWCIWTFGFVKWSDKVSVDLSDPYVIIGGVLFYFLAGGFGYVIFSAILEWYIQGN